MALLVAEKTLSKKTQGTTAESSDAAVSRDEQAWDVQFAGSRDVLEELYDEITADHEAGRTVPIQA